ncbi:MAG: sensor domain-containing diguanylate cyclase [Bacillota bacterium]|nr:sensor domain-containing diguanylate cyclase [Bacillota bacterium]
MKNYEELLEKYERLKEEFETYQNFAESTIQLMNEKNTKLEKKLDSLTNIVEVGKYINSNVSEDNLIPMINDMIIGILGVTYSSIYLLQPDGKLIVKATNVFDGNHNFLENDFFSELNNGKPFVVNSKEKLFEQDNRRADIHSVIGVPVYLRERFMGYIIVEHTLCNFFGHDHITFISGIANQIGIALENNFLYKKVMESSIKDPLLGIFNRKYFFNFVEDEVKNEPNKAFAIVMLDIDNFKKFNDNYGHQFGDEVLIQVAKVIKNNIGENDKVARYGGEEIVIYLHRVEGYDETYRRVDELREKLSLNIVQHGEIKKTVTASFGISFYPGDGNDVQNVVSVADAMMYEAKKRGKNRVISSKNSLLREG